MNEVDREIKLKSSPPPKKKHGTTCLQSIRKNIKRKSGQHMWKRLQRDQKVADLGKWTDDIGGSRHW